MIITRIPKLLQESVRSDCNDYVLPLFFVCMNLFAINILLTMNHD